MRLNELFLFLVFLFGIWKEWEIGEGKFIEENVGIQTKSTLSLPLAVVGLIGMNSSTHNY